MAELIWRAADPKAVGHVATYNSYGARVEIYRDGPGTGPTIPGRPGTPGWVTVAQGLMEQRMREYLDATGRMPSRKLLEDFQREMRKRLDAYIQDPMKHPFRPMGLKEFEDESGGTA